MTHHQILSLLRDAQPYRVIGVTVPGHYLFEHGSFVQLVVCTTLLVAVNLSGSLHVLVV